MKALNSKIIIFGIFLVTFCIFYFSANGPTPYNYFTRLALAFLHGRYYITDNPPWLSELIPIASNKFAIVYPPAPAILLMPFVFLFGTNFSQTIFANIVGSLIVVVGTLLTFEITKNKLKTLYITLLIALGNILWFMSANGSVWLLGQTTAVLFLLLAIYYLEANLSAQAGKNSLLIGIFLGIAFLSRVETILSFPFFFFILKNYKNKTKFLIGLVPFILFYLFYNFLRFGNLFQTGYPLIPGVLQEPWYDHGIISPFYILRNLKVMFLSLPVSRNNFPYIIPSWGGLSIAITSPVFIYAFFNDPKNRKILLSFFSIITILILVLMHGESGYAQFGFRFAADIYPFIFYLIIKHLEKNNLKWHHWLLLFFSILVNVWGIILINKFGIVAP